MARHLILLIAAIFTLSSNAQSHAQEFVKISGVIQLPENAIPQPSKVEVSVDRGSMSVLAKTIVKVNQKFELFVPKNMPFILQVSAEYRPNVDSKATMRWRSKEDSYSLTSDKELVINLPLLNQIQGTLEDASGQPLTGTAELSLAWQSDKRILANDGILWTLEGGQFSSTAVKNNGSFVLYGAPNEKETLRVQLDTLNFEWRSWYFSNKSNPSVRICLPLNFGVNRELSKECLLEWSIGLTAFEAEIKARMEAEAKAKAEAAKKKTTITCVKGKTLKKVTAVNPKCPSGYKKK